MNSNFYRRKPCPRFLRAVLVALLDGGLALPSPAFALRQPTVEGAGLEELTQTLVSASPTARMVKTVPKNSIAVYLDTQVGPGLQLDTPYLVTEKIPANLWTRPEIVHAGAVALVNVPTVKIHDVWTFGVAGRHFSIDDHVIRRGRALRLTVLVNPTDQKPTRVFDSRTGDPIPFDSRPFPIARQDRKDRLYLDAATIQEGKLVVTGEPYKQWGNRLWIPWSDDAVRAAKTVVVTGVRTHHISGRYSPNSSPQQRGIAFTMDGTIYHSLRTFDRPPRLMVQINPATRRPIAAWTMTGGKQVYPMEQQIRIYLDATVKDGERDPTSPLFWAGNRLLNYTDRKSVWDDIAAARPQTVVIENLSVRHIGRRPIFFMRYSTYFLDASFPLDHHLLVVANPEGVPQSVYDMATGMAVQFGAVPWRSGAGVGLEETSAAGAQTVAGQEIRERFQAAVNAWRGGFETTPTVVQNQGIVLVLPGALAVAEALRQARVPVIAVETDEARRATAVHLLGAPFVAETVAAAFDRLQTHYGISHPIIVTDDLMLAVTRPRDATTVPVADAREAVAYLQRLEFLPNIDSTPLLQVGLDEAKYLEQIRQYYQ